MKRLIIRNLGALKDVDISFSQVNVIIGPQSLGKSTILKVASYCTWLEKRIELSGILTARSICMKKYKNVFHISLTNIKY